MSARRWVLGAGLGAAAVQIVPAATWLPAVRRVVWPALAGVGADDAVALSFDDGPHPQATPAVLDVLDALRWRATFFVLGGQVRRYPDILAEVVRRGHEVALHGDEHRYLLARSPRAARDDLQRGRDTIAEATGCAPTWWRPPYGVLTGPALLAARGLGLRPILWSAWGRDWRAAATGQSVVDDLRAGRLAGGTMLLHDSDVTSDHGAWQATVAALPLLAAHLAEQGVRVLTVGEQVRR